MFESAVFVFVVMCLILANSNWLGTRGSWLDPWEYIGQSIGLQPASVSGLYKQDRLLWMLAINWLQTHFGVSSVSRIVAIAVMLSSAFVIPFAFSTLSRRTRYLGACLILLNPGLHGLGGWLSPSSITPLMAIVLLGLGLRGVSDRGTCWGWWFALGFTASLSVGLYPPVLIGVLGIVVSAIAIRISRESGTRPALLGLACGVVAYLCSVVVLRWTLGFPLFSSEQIRKTSEIWNLFRSKPPETSWVNPEGLQGATHLSAPIAALAVLAWRCTTTKYRKHVPQEPAGHSLVHFSSAISLGLLVVLWLLRLPLLPFEYQSALGTVLGLMSLAIFCQGLTLVDDGVESRKERLIRLTILALVLGSLVTGLTGVLSRFRFVSPSIELLSGIALVLTFVILTSRLRPSGDLLVYGLPLLVLVLPGDSGFSGDQSFKMWNRLTGISIPTLGQPVSAYSLVDRCDRINEEMSVISALVQITRELSASALVFEESLTKGAIEVYDDCTISVVGIEASVQRSAAAVSPRDANYFIIVHRRDTDALPFPLEGVDTATLRKLRRLELGEAQTIMATVFERAPN